MNENILDKVMKKSIAIMISTAESDKKISKLEKKHEKKYILFLLGIEFLEA